MRLIVSLFTWDWRPLVAQEVEIEVTDNRAHVHDQLAVVAKKLLPNLDFKHLHITLTQGRVPTVEEAKEYYRKNGADTEGWEGALTAVYNAQPPQF